MKIAGIQSLTLLDYPGKLATTVFLKGCNFKCPFCHNKGIISSEADHTCEWDKKSILKHLNKRRTLIDGVCISGGEPTIHEDLPDFLDEIKNLGFSVKLDTNGSNPRMLKECLYRGVVDYIAMDIKTSLVDTSYDTVAGVKTDKDAIKESINIIMDDGLIDYEFRTTVVGMLHFTNDFKEIGKLVKGARLYALQQYMPIDSPSCVMKKPTPNFMHACRRMLLPYVDEVILRGVE